MFRVVVCVFGWNGVGCVICCVCRLCNVLCFFFGSCFFLVFGLSWGWSWLWWFVVWIGVVYLLFMVWIGWLFGLLGFVFSKFGLVSSLVWWYVYVWLCFVGCWYCCRFGCWFWWLGLGCWWLVCGWWGRFCYFCVCMGMGNGCVGCVIFWCCWYGVVVILDYLGVRGVVGSCYFEVGLEFFFLGKGVWFC